MRYPRDGHSIVFMIVAFECIVLGVSEHSVRCGQKQFICGNYAALCVRQSDADDTGSDVCRKNELQLVYNYPGSCMPKECTSEVRNYCEENPCANSGECVPFIGFYFCKCPPGFRGPQCKEMGEQVAKEVYFVFNPVTLTGRRSSIIFVKDPKPGIKIKFTAESSGEVVTVTKDQLRGQTSDGLKECMKIARRISHLCEFVRLEGKTLYYANIFYDIPYIKDDPGVILDLGKPLFKVNNIKLEIFNEGDGSFVEFSNTFKQTTVYKFKNQCAAQVKLINCGDTSETPLSLARKSSETIRSIFEDNVDCLDSQKSYSWKIYNYEHTLMNPSPEPIVYEKGEENEFQYFIVEPFQLDIGLYLVNLTIDLIMLKTHQYFNVCFIEIKSVPLSAQIKGDYKRTVFVNADSIILDASMSYDPNRPLGQQDHLVFHWSCVSHDDISCTAGSQDTNMCVIERRLSLGDNYEFQLELGTKDGSNPPVRVSQFITPSEKKQVELELVCLKNCGVEDFKTNPRDIVYMEVKVIGDVVVNRFHWSYTPNGGQERDVADIRKNDRDLPILVVKENSLNPGDKYTFTAKLAGTQSILEGSSSMSILVNNFPVAGSCVMSPTFGTKIKTVFDISCSNFTDDNDISQLNYEFYQKAAAEPEPGTLIGFSISGEMKKFILTENIVMIRASDIYGAYSSLVSAQVNLNDWSPDIEEVKSLLAEASVKAKSRDEVGAVVLAGAIIDVMESVENKMSVLNDVLEILNEPKPIDFSDVRLLASILNKVVRKGAPQVENRMDSKSIRASGTLMASIGKTMFQIILNLDQKKSTIEREDVDNVILSMAKCTDILVASKDEEIFQSSKGSLEMFKTHDNYKKGTSSMLKALNDLGLVIASTMLPQEIERVIKSQDTVFWMKLESPTALTSISEIPQNSTTSVKISENLGKYLEEMAKYVAIEVIMMINNPYWWDATDGQISSEILSLRVWKKTPEVMQSIIGIPEPVDIYLKIKYMQFETVSGVLTQPSPSDSEDQKDASVGVHTLEAPEENSNGRLFVQMVNFDDLDEFRVIITSDYRPDYELMVEKANTLTAQSASLNLSFENIADSTLHFVGILPGLRVPPGKTVSYSMRIFSMQCKVRQETVWTSPACVVGEGTTSDVVHCLCSHMSFFGSSIFVAPNTVHPIKDLHLFATLNDNPLVFSFIVTLLIIYCLLLIWALIQDKKNKLKRKIIILDDNYPGDSCPYLIVVYTAFNIGSATESKVGLRLIGKNSTTFSRAHVLQCHYRKVLRRNADDWFLLFTPEHLGPIEAIHLWHNHSGSHPDWFCKRIKVYDMDKSEEYNFLVHRWMSAEPDEYVEVVVRVATTKETYNWKSCIIHNIIYHLRENHLWVSIFLCHPRATVSKSQRLTLTFCIIMVTFLTGVMFYGVARKDRVEDEHKYEIKAREIVVAIMSSVVSAIIVSFVLLSFKRSRVIVRTPENKTESKPSLSNLRSSLNGSKTDASKNKGIVMKYIRKVLHGIVKGKPLMPVLVGKETSESVVRRKRWATVGWVASQIIIWTCAFFVILYGLKLGKVTSELWATAAVMCFLKTIFITAPIKIVSFSAILALYGEMYDVTNFECVIETAIRKEVVGDLNFLKRLIELRSRPIYHPLSRSEVRELRQKALLRNQTLEYLEQAVIIFFFVVLFNVTGDLWQIRNYYVNSHASQVLSDSKGTFPIGLRDVISATKLTDYLLAKLLPSLYKEKWYNGKILTSAQESLPDMGWVSDTVHRLIGIPQFRQIRVKQRNSCSFLIYFNISETSCLPALTLESEDTGNYGLAWGPINEYINKPLRRPFSYQRGLEEHPTVLGDSGTVYHSGGYVARLDATQKKCNAIVSDLMDNGWWDIRMRAFIVEVTLFNPNTRSHTMATITVEHLPAGTFTSRTTVVTVHAVANYTIVLLFAMAMFYFNFRLFLFVNRRGFSYAITNFWSCYEFLFVWTSNIAVGFEVVKILRVVTTVRVFIQSGNSGFFHFSNIVLYEKVSLWLWCLVLCVAPVKSLKFKFLRSTCRAAFFAFRRCWGRLLAVGLVIGVLTVFQLFVLNFAICPVIKPLDVKTRFHKTRTNDFDFGPYSFLLKVISIFLAVTYTVANIIVQVIIIYYYKIMSDY